MDVITSLDNQYVKQARSLQDKKFRRNLGQFLVEGKKLIVEAEQKGLVIDKLFVDQSKLKEYENYVTSCSAPVYFCSSNVIKSICSTTMPQGLVAVINLPPIDLYNHKKGDKLIVLDRISDPGNLGTIVRTACATGFDKILTIDCVDPFSPKVVRASAGAVFDTKIYPSTEQEVMQICEKHNILAIVADMDGENLYTSDLPSDNYAIVIGNEGGGVSQNLKDYGKMIKLPMKNTMESLNAGVSASVIMYALEGKNIK